MQDSLISSWKIEQLKDREQDDMHNWITKRMGDMGSLRVIIDNH